MTPLCAAGATKRLSAADATDKSAVYDLAGTYGNAGQAPSGLSLPETFDRSQRRDLFLCGIPAHLKVSLSMTAPAPVPVSLMPVREPSAR